MKLWGYIKRVAGWVWPSLAESALEKFRRKNPKHGWLVDAVEGALGHIEKNELTASATNASKVEIVSQQVVRDFPGTSLHTAREITRLAIRHRQAK